MTSCTPKSHGVIGGLPTDTDAGKVGRAVGRGVCVVRVGADSGLMCPTMNCAVALTMGVCRDVLKQTSMAVARTAVPEEGLPCAVCDTVHIDRTCRRRTICSSCCQSGYGDLPTRMADPGAPPRIRLSHGSTLLL